MPNRVAFGLAALIVLIALVDGLASGGGGFMFLARKFLDLVSYVAFWR
ncbi:hypothetical protein [Pontitalea aquivivens]